MPNTDEPGQDEDRAGPGAQTRDLSQVQHPVQQLIRPQDPAKGPTRERTQDRAQDRTGDLGGDEAGEAARRRRRAQFLRELHEAKALRERVKPRQARAARMRQQMRMRTFRW
jgi:hypothetical protein